MMIKSNKVSWKLRYKTEKERKKEKKRKEKEMLSCGQSAPKEAKHDETRPRGADDIPD